MIDLFIFRVKMLDFLQEIQQLRASLPAKLQTERNLKEYEDAHRQLFRNRLLIMDNDAIEEYYQQYKTKLKIIAGTQEDLYLTYWDDPRFDPIHQIIVQKFQEDGIDAYRTFYGYSNAFDFRNII